MKTKRIASIPHCADSDGCCRAIRATTWKTSVSDFDPYTRNPGAWVTAAIEVWKIPSDGKPNDSK